MIGAYVTVNGTPEAQFEADLIAQVAGQLSPHMAPKWVRVLGLGHSWRVVGSAPTPFQDDPGDVLGPNATRIRLQSI